MSRKQFMLIICSMLCVLLVRIPSTWAQTSLQYQDRGNRYEGVKRKPVAGYDIELISVRADYVEPAHQLPEEFKVRFYLKQTSDVYLTVREVEYTHYYWLDNVKPTRRPNGFDNEFTWPTQDVICQLDGLGMYDLGVVARLEREEPGKIERVTPVILYYSQLPKTITGYLFTLKTNGDARLRCMVYKDEESEPIFTQDFRRQRGGRPFTVRWESATALEGRYKLVVKGYFLNTSDPIDQIVEFYHQPHVGGPTP
jgi:hypothetical protein